MKYVAKTKVLDIPQGQVVDGFRWIGSTEREVFPQWFDEYLDLDVVSFIDHRDYGEVMAIDNGEELLIVANGEYVIIHEGKFYMYNPRRFDEIFREYNNG